jgi:hypothetical protein
VKSWSRTPFPEEDEYRDEKRTREMGTCLEKSFDCHIALFLSKFREGVS